MDAYEATKIVFTRIQSLDPENSAKIMGLLLLQDHGEKEMIRLAFGPETLIHSLVLKARKDLNLMPGSLQSPSPVSPSPVKATGPSFMTNHQKISGIDVPKFASIGGDFVDELPHQEQFLYPEVECPSPGWGVNGHHGKSCSLNGSGNFSGLVEDGGVFGNGWKPCMYFARGYCKNGSDCRFIHGLLDQNPVTGSKMDAAADQQCHELLLKSKNSRIGVLGSPSQLMASAFPYSPIGSPSGSNKCFNYLLQQQQNENQRAAAAAEAATLMFGGDESPKFLARSRFDRSDLIPGSRQIYLTFPADSTFREEDVSNYFSIYGPVQDVRIPYQQKRMFGFVTFMFPETVKLILAKGNPHFVCDARVLVKPYKEKGKVPDKFRKFQQCERGDFSVCTTPTGLGLDSRGDPYDLQQFGARMMYSNGNSQELLLRRKLEEQHQAAELQKAIEFQNRRFMGLQLIDLKHINFSQSPSFNSTAINNNSPIFTTADEKGNDSRSSYSSNNSIAVSSPQDGVAGNQKLNNCHGFRNQTVVNPLVDKEESKVEGKTKIHRQFQESGEHNLPDSPFASPTKSSVVLDPFIAPELDSVYHSGSNNDHLISPTYLPPSSTLNMASLKSCFFPMPPRISSNHGAIGM